jgi:phage tail-like protein
MAVDKDPLVSAWFSLEFQGAITGAFKECTGIGSESAVVEHKASGPKGEYVMLHVPGRMKWNDVTLKRGVTNALDIWKWRKLVEDGKLDDARKNGSIKMYSQDGKEVARWDFVNAWPSKITGPAANAGSNDIAVEEFVLTHEGYTRVS